MDGHTDKVQPRHLTVVLADSGIGGRDEDAPPVRQGLGLLGISGEVQVHAKPLRLLEQQLPLLDDIIERRPDLVVVGHGGSESLTFPRPSNAGLVSPPADVQRREAERWSRNNRMAHYLRRTARRAVRRHQHSVVRFEDFEVTVALVIDRLLAETSAKLVFIGGKGADPSYFPHDRTFTVQCDRLLLSLPRLAPTRIATVLSGPHLRRWEDYQPDRCHLRPSGMAVVARLFAQAMTQLQSAASADHANRG
jgi:hypothetical protein